MNKKISFLACLLVLSGCSATEDTTDTTQTTDSTTKTEEASTSDDTSSTETSEDTDTSEDTETSEDTDTSESSSSNTITFGDELSSSDDNVSIEDNKATITKAGTYTVTGTSSDGNLEINAPGQAITLNIKDLDLTASSNAAIRVVDASNLIISIEGDNSLTDSTSNSEDQAPIYIDEVPTTVEGDGTLNITGNAQEGFEINNDLIINSGTLNITSQDDGINAGDKLTINGGNINIDCQGDGIDSNGSLVINGGTSIVSAGNNGNGPIDFGDNAEDTFKLNGGTLISVGGTMGVTPSDNDQTYRASNANGSTISVDGKEYKFDKQFGYYFVSTPDLTEDTKILVDGVEITTETTSTMGGGPGF